MIRKILKFIPRSADTAISQPSFNVAMPSLSTSTVRSAQAFYVDRWLLLTATLLIIMGLLMVASSSMVISDRQYGAPFHYFIRQVVYLGVGTAFIALLLRTPIAYLRKYSGYLLLLSIFLLFLVLVPGLGRQVNGSSRWLHLGFISFQISELAKLGIVIYLASYLVRHQEEVQTRFSGFIKPFLILGVAAILLLKEPDFGATTVIFFTALGMLFLAGARLWQFILLVILGGGGLAFLALTSPYRLQRLTTFLNPWSNPFDSGYQLTQSLIAFGRGGILGVGLGNSVQKLFYLPEAHTDFLFAVLAEELGLIGEISVLVLFIILIGRALWLGRQAHQAKLYFSAYLAYGLGLMLALQTIVSIGVNCGLLPTKGLTLPLMSYGGSSMLISMIMIGILLRISYELNILTKDNW